MSAEAKSCESTPEKARQLSEDAAGPEDEAGRVEEEDRSSSAESRPTSRSKSEEAPVNADAGAEHSSPSESADAETTAAAATADPAAPPLPNEPVPGTGTGTEARSLTENAPPLPSEPLPSAEPEDDGWECHWNPNTSSYWFYNRFTGVWQQENPRVPGADSGTTAAAVPGPAVLVPESQDRTVISDPVSVAGGYNPAIHGDYDENAWYAQNARVVADPSSTSTAAGTDLAGAAGGNEYASGGFFNVRTGQWQTPEQGVERHSDEAKSRRQMNAFFDVDAAANMHDGRSLKAERAGKKPTKAELKMFKEKRRAKKEEKRRAWLRD